MNQQQICELLGIPDRTLRDWKKGGRSKLYNLLETLDYEAAQELLNINNNDLRKLLENAVDVPTLPEIFIFLETAVNTSAPIF